MKIIGHRGAMGLAPENTLAAIDAGLAAGAEIIEVDVRVSRDGTPLLSHGLFVHGIDNKPRSILTHDFNSIKQFAPDICTLDEALRHIGKDVPVMVEVKIGTDSKPVIDVFQHLLREGWPVENIWIASKGSKLLRELHTALPKLTTVVIEPWSGVRASYRARTLRTPYIAMRSTWLRRGFIRMMNLRGFKIIPYTVNDPKKLDRWKPFLYAVVTDRPDRYTS